MLALEIFLNGEKLGVAGADDMSVLTAMVQAGGKLGPSSVSEYEFEEDEREVGGIGAIGDDEEIKPFYISLSTGGLSGSEENLKYPTWIQFLKIKAGDVININIIETDRVDKPASIRNDGDANGFADEREMFDKCKEWYFELCDKYEDKG